MNISIDPGKKYNKKEIMSLLEFNESQLKEAENNKLIKFSDNTMYGVFFFQFLKLNCLQLEKIKNEKT